MHTTIGDENGTAPLSAVPAFLAKLWKLLEDPETDDLICWSDSGMSFFIRNQAMFSRQLLPLYYKHNNMASFVRQLNMYGFRKVTSVEQGGLRVDKDEMEFQHNYFVRGHEYLLENIKRKLPSAARHIEDVEKGRPEVVKRMLSEVRALKGKQDSVDSRLANMKRENEALWREVASLRQKHFKQQQIVNKLIQFLVTLVQRNDITGKRRYPLAIRESGDIELDSVGGKQRRRMDSQNGPIIHDITNDLVDVVDPSSAETSSPSPQSARPQSVPIPAEAAEGSPVYVIEHQVEEDQESYVQGDPESYPLAVRFQIGDEPIQVIAAGEENRASENSPSPAEEMIAVDPTTLRQRSDPEPSGEAFLDDSLLVPDLDLPLSFEDVMPQGKFSGKHQKSDDKRLALASDTNLLNSRDEFDSHIESFEMELDGLKNLIALQNVNSFDASSLLSVSKMALASFSTLFDTEDPLPMPMPSTSSSNSSARTGNELMTYNPMLDLGYDDHNFFGSERESEADSEFLLNDGYLLDVKPSASQLSSTLNTPVYTPKSPPSFGQKKK